eukprot:tig00020964_g16811.t1
MGHSEHGPEEGTHRRCKAYDPLAHGVIDENDDGWDFSRQSSVFRTSQPRFNYEKIAAVAHLGPGTYKMRLPEVAVKDADKPSAAFKSAGRTERRNDYVSDIGYTSIRLGKFYTPKLGRTSPTGTGTTVMSGPALTASLDYSPDNGSLARTVQSSPIRYSSFQSGNARLLDPVTLGQAYPMPLSRVPYARPLGPGDYEPRDPARPAIGSPPASQRSPHRPQTSAFLSAGRANTAPPARPDTGAYVLDHDRREWNRHGFYASRQARFPEKPKAVGIDIVYNTDVGPKASVARSALESSRRFAAVFRSRQKREIDPRVLGGTRMLHKADGPDARIGPGTYEPDASAQPPRQQRPSAVFRSPNGRASLGRRRF